MLLVLAPVALAALAVSPFSQPAPDAPVVRVRYADLDLSRASDRKRLDSRIATAIDRACQIRPPGQLTRSLEGPRCRVDMQRQVAPQRARVVARFVGGAVRLSTVR